MNETHLPAAPPPDIRLAEADRNWFDAPFGRLVTDSKGILQLHDLEGTPIVEAFGLWREPVPATVSVVVRESDTQFSLVWDGPDECATLTFALAETANAFDISLEIEFRSPRRVIRDALVLRVSPALVLAAKLNGYAAESPPDCETWLGRGTVVYRESARSIAVVHPTELSSLQIDPPGRRLWLNFEWAEDHPHVVFSRTANWDDASAIEWPAGTHRLGIVRLYCCPGEAPIVRPMLAPNGALGVFVWTEHACNCDLRTHRAVYFGHEDIARAKDAIGGFVKHGIPATKSVFYDNDIGQGIFVREAVVQGDMVAIRTNPAFEAYLLELRDTGIYEIVPHGVQPNTTPRAKTAEALDYMRRVFDSRSWIDHSAFRRDFVSGGNDGYLAFGLDPASEHYRGDMWRDFGYRYFWNHATEYKEVVPRHSPTKDSSPSVPSLSRIKHIAARMLPHALLSRIRKRKLDGQSDRGPDRALDQLSAHPARPTPIWWRNSEATGQFLNWSTRATASSYFRPGDGPIMRRRLDGLVTCWGIDLHHSYPTRVERNNATWREDEHGKFAVSEAFDETLRHMAALRDAGDLHVGTVRGMMAHWEALEKLRIVLQADGTTLLQNRSQSPARGVALAVRDGTCRIEGCEYRIRRVGRDWILWCDLPPNGQVKVVRTDA